MFGATAACACMNRDHSCVRPCPFRRRLERLNHHAVTRLRDEPRRVAVRCRAVTKATRERLQTVPMWRTGFMRERRGERVAPPFGEHGDITKLKGPQTWTYFSLST